MKIQRKLTKPQEVLYFVCPVCNKEQTITRDAVETYKKKAVCYYCECAQKRDTAIADAQKRLVGARIIAVEVKDDDWSELDEITIDCPDGKKRTLRADGYDERYIGVEE